MRATTHHRGFTLVEILVVVMILGIASAIIIPQLGTRDDLKAAAGARLILADLAYAQNRAVTTQQKHYIQFTGQQYTIFSRPDDSAPLTAINHPVNKDTYTQTFGSAANPSLRSITLGTCSFEGQPILGFDELGAPFSYEAGTNTINPLSAPGSIVIDCGSHQLTLNIEPYSGEATVN